MYRRYFAITLTLFVLSFLAGYLGMELYTFHQLLGAVE